MSYHQGTAAGTEGQGANGLVIQFEGHFHGPAYAGKVPDQQAAVNMRGKTTAVGIKGDHAEPARMVERLADLSIRERVADADLVVVAAGQEIAAVRAEIDV